MKKITVITALLLVFPGCGKDESKEVYSSPEGKIEVHQQKNGQTQKMTLSTEDGTTTVTIGQQPLPDNLRVPLYPGVSREDAATWNMNGTGQGRNESFASIMLQSKDSLDKVFAFYKEQLSGRDPKIFQMDTPGGKMASLVIEEGENQVISIMLTENQETGSTQIQINQVTE